MRALMFAVAVLAGAWALLVAGLALAGRRAAARELIALVPTLGVLFRGLLKDPRVPRRSRVLLVLGAAWIASPIDLIPEFIPVLGALDDAIVAALVLRHVLRSAGPDAIADHWRGSEAMLRRILALRG